MGVLSLFLVASTPSIQVLLIGLVGAYLASGYSNILLPAARRDMNKVVFIVFTPSLIFASLAQSVTLQDIISWWFMPVNIGIIFLLGSIFGWIAVKILRPPRHLENLVIPFCTAGNLGNLLLIIIPALCDEEGNPFGDRENCKVRGLSYVSFSMALGGLYIWTHTYSYMKKSVKTYRRSQLEDHKALANDNKDSITVDDRIVDNLEAHVSLTDGVLPISVKAAGDAVENQTQIPLLSQSSEYLKSELSFWEKLKRGLHQIVEELMAPPTVSAIIGTIFGAIPWLKSLVIGQNAPLKVVQDSLQLLGNGTLPCITLILGGNLTQGLHKSLVRPIEIIVIICVRYLVLPVFGVAVVKAASAVGFLPHDPLYRYILMTQFTLPPAMTIGTMAQLFDVGQEECSVIFLWTYLVAAAALTGWSTIFLWILS